MSRRFRWTDLQVKRLRLCPTADDFRNALDNLPKSLEETYHRALETIPEVHQGRMRKVLIWLTSSLRELTSSEVAAIVAFPFVEDVLRICTSVLITVIDGDFRETIKLAHFTVKEFLIIREGFEVGLHWYRFSAQLANRCVTTQTIDAVFGYPPTEPRVLHGYASQFWLAHARQIDAIPGSATSDKVQSRVNSLLEVDNREQLLDWRRKQFPLQVDLSRSINLFLHPTYYASMLGLQRSVMHFWKGDYSELNQRPGFYGNALDAAACMGHVEIVVWLVDHIENPLSHLDLPRVVQYLRTNVPQTLRALLQKGPKPSISPEVVYALTINPMGEEILKVLIEEDLATIFMTEELISTAAHNKWNRKIVEYLANNRPHEFPINLRTLGTVAQTSHYAMQLLVESRKGDIWFAEQDCLELANTRPYTVQKLLSLGVTIPITTKLIETLVTSPVGSQTLKLLLDTQTIERPLTSLEVLMVAKGSSLETFESLVRHRWANNQLTEELVLAIVFDCYLDPPAITTIPDQEISPNGLVHEKYRPILRRLPERSRSTSLIYGRETRIRLTKRVIGLISEQFEKAIMSHPVDGVADIRILAPDATYDQFSSLLKKHASNLGLSSTILQALDDSYMPGSTFALTAQRHVSRCAIAETISNGVKPPKAICLGPNSLPMAFPGRSYSSSEYDDKTTIYVPPPVQLDSALYEARLPEGYDTYWQGISDLSNEEAPWRDPPREISEEYFRSSPSRGISRGSSESSPESPCPEIASGRRGSSSPSSSSSEEEQEYSISQYPICPRAPRPETLYSCRHCSAYFKSSHDVRRHHSLVHTWSRSWSCAALIAVVTGFHKLSTTGGATDICGCCGEESNPANREYQLDHILREHRFGVCKAEKFDHGHEFRKHIEYNHAGKSGRWMDILVATCLHNEPPQQPISTAVSSDNDHTSTNSCGYRRYVYSGNIRHFSKKRASSSRGGEGRVQLRCRSVRGRQSRSRKNSFDMWRMNIRDGLS
jgi:hypothetical protein